MIRIIISLFLTGIALGAGPCMASCGPLLISYTAATKRGFKDSLRVYVIFSLSRIFVYLVLGLLIGLFSQYFLHQNFQETVSKYAYIVGGAFISLIGLLVILGKEPNSKFCQVLRKNLIEKDTKSILIFGLIVGISPCGPLIAVLSYIGLTSFSWLKGMLFSLSFGLGTIISPLLFLVLLAGFINKIFKNKENFYQLFQKFCGFILCLFGLYLLIITLIYNPPTF